MNNNAMFNISYGLFVLTSEYDGKKNGCIINTAMQVTVAPNRISVAVNKSNYTHDIIMKSGVFNISVLDTTADFSIFRHFGFQSGKDTEKIETYDNIAYSKNGISYLSKNANAFISGKVIEKIDLGTHTMFIADVTDAEVLSDYESMTYSYYHANVKPKPEAKKEEAGFRCKICGYVYKGESLPEDYICPLCKHPAEDFEPITNQ